MMPCPDCGSATSVIETRVTGTNVRRRRRCGNGHRVTTMEIAFPESARSRSGPDLVAVPRAHLESIRAAAGSALGVAVAVPSASGNECAEINE